ncbi:winged helix-turn-helix domain-containing protein [Actinomadura hallensis]|uniref:winged helix-turn-helix domain-containing protein n=1 Tax=Actinomadura hallensis TaxID=337895 RepID=UPI001154F215|nr:transcriptional regulator [Actinomadura hallensis]
MHGVSYRFDGFELDTSLYELRRAGERIPVEPRALDVLHYLIVNRDRVVSKEELLDAVWGDRFVSEAAITTALRTARMAIGDTGKEQRLIRTVFRRGYQFTGTVAQTAAEPRPGDGRGDGRRNGPTFRFPPGWRCRPVWGSRAGSVSAQCSPTPGRTSSPRGGGGSCW